MIKGAKGIISHWNAIFMSFAFLAIRLLFRYNYAMIVLWLEETILSEYYKFFQNKKCEYFPCHKGIPEEDFNCLFCYCPLYTLGKSCGGNCEYLKNGIKSCINCGFPHHRKNYDKVTGRFQEIAAVSISLRMTCPIFRQFIRHFFPWLNPMRITLWIRI